MNRTTRSKKLFSVLLALVMALAAAPLLTSTFAPSADAAVATNRNSTNYVPGHYYYYPAGTQFIKSIHVGYDKDSDKAKNNARNDENPNLLDADWLSGMGSNIFKRYNYIYIAYGTTTDISQAWGTYIRMKHSSGTPATQAFTVNGRSVNFTLGSDVDFNEARGSGSDYIYLYKTNDPAYGLPITEFRKGNGNNDSAKWESYFLTAERDNTGEVSDLNRGAGGDYIWLHYGNYSVYTDVTTQVNALKAAIDEANAVNEGDCTAESYANLVAAKNAALPLWNAYNANVYKCATVTAAELQSKTAALNNALNAIVTRAYFVNFHGAGNTGGSMTQQKLPVNAARNLNANGFTREFSVSYVYNGATDGNSVVSDTAVSSFSGWATSLYGTNAYTDRQSVQGLSTVENAEIELYANWTDSAVTLPDPKKDGYRFVAWYSDPSLSDNYRVGFGGGSYTPPAETTLYAKWEEQTYTRVGYTVGTGYTVTQQPAASAKMSDVLTIKLKLEASKFKCEPVVTVNTGTVTAKPHNAGALERTYEITGIAEDYTIEIGDAVEPTYTVTFIDGLSGEVLSEVTDLALGATDVEAPAVKDYEDYTDDQHLKFTGWDQPYTPVNGNLTITSVYEAEDHVWQDAELTTPATCQHPGEKTVRCRWCTAATTETIPAGAHSFTRKAVSDEYLKSPATCTVPAEYYYACQNCDEKGTATYAYGEPLSHTLTKTDAVEPTCTSGGNEAYWTCGECGRMFSDENAENRIETVPALPAKGHALTTVPAESPTCVEPGTVKYFRCTRCEKLFSDQAAANEITAEDTVAPPTGRHALSKTAAQAATCTADGHIAYWTCSVCKQKFSDQNAATAVSDAELVVAHTGHSFTAEKAENRYLKSAATCTEAAVYYVSCSKCGEKGTETFVYGEPNGHRFFWVTDRAATCSEAGLQHEKCRDCAETRSLDTPIEPTGRHSYTAKSVKAEALKAAASCTAPAVYYYSCSVCGAVENSASHTFTSGSAKGHSFGAWTTDRAATCTAEGAQHRTCADCGYAETRTLDKTAHTDADGNDVCDDCGANLAADLCPYCHQRHDGAFGWLIAFFHRIAYFFRTLFNR